MVKLQQAPSRQIKLQQRRLISVLALTCKFILTELHHNIHKYSANGKMWVCGSADVENGKVCTTMRTAEEDPKFTHSSRKICRDVH